MSGAAQPFAGLRTGFGLAAVKLAGALPRRLAGVDTGTGGVDSDAVSAAVLDALLAAGGLADLEALLDPVEHASTQGDIYTRLSYASGVLLRQRLQAVLNLDVKLVCAQELPAGLRAAITGNLAAALGIAPGQVSFNAAAQPLTPGVERGEALACFAYVLCVARQVPAGTAREPRQPWAEAPLKSGPAGSAAAGDIPAGRPREFERAVRSKLPPLPAAPPPVDGDTLIVYTDGASRGNPGPAAAGWVVLDAQGRLVGEGGKTLGERTNNQAEYLAVQEAAKWIELNFGRAFNLLLRADSELVVKQLRGEYKVKDAELRELALQTMSLLMFFSTFELNAVPRAENARADALANRALDEQRG